MDYDILVDARGLSCPMPIVKTKQELNKVESGKVIKVLATDKGSVKDFQGFVNADKNLELIKQDVEKDDQGKDVYVHYIRKK
ncbi:MAG: sulfurtransferase TusA family protein [bacterium]